MLFCNLCIASKRYFLANFGLFLLSWFVLSVAHADDGHFLVLNYHDIIESKAQPVSSTDVSVDRLEAHIVWLRDHGYHIIRVQDVFDAAAGKTALPKQSVLLTFDDGYQSFYSKVFPL